MLTNQSATDVRAWELISDVPLLNANFSYGIAFLNVIFPGVGTMLASCLGDDNVNKTQLFIGFAQFLTSVYIVGWIASMYWGYLIVKKVSAEEHKVAIGKGV